MKRSSVVTVLVALSCLTACMSFIDGWGGISPSQFEFQPMVPLRGQGPGGWKSARVVITLLHVTPGDVRRKVTCPIEVQVPEVNRLGVVSNEFAQMEAAKAADIAAERTLAQGGLSAEMCERFKNEMQEVMGKTIGGVRVIKSL
ncbi:hypothetical protein JQX13_26035 [Archangium violaceum]|uniref:hypothetical protein n=1 Tax=Archangium violaceum TaxID=83451 RepID=UPI00193C8387|nr:hypothetical protein [Archangium violaceum]QRK13183.1 hypothetical protein JQX13_26035 [Archangium violaceum]